MIFFTSDTHFFHKNVIEYCNRPYKSIEEMNEQLIKNWNSKITDADEVYHLGDFAFCGREKFINVLNQLRGIKYWVRGNHDKDLVKKPEVQGFFQWIKPLTNIRIKRVFEHEGSFLEFDQKIVLCHFPILSWEGMSNGSWHLHGHSHGSLPPDRNKRMDVGVDANPAGCYPFSIVDVEEYMASKNFNPVDHHGK